MVNLYAFPYAFGGANIYESLKKHLDKNIKLMAINYPGHETEWEKPLLTSIQEIAAYAYEQLEDNFVEDYALLGYSMGGIVCYELFQLLKKNNRKLPQYIFLFAADEPDHEQEQKDFANYDIEQIRAELIKLDGTPDELLYNDELIEFTAPIIKSDLMALAMYVPTESSIGKISSPVTVIRGIEEEDMDNCHKGWEKYIEKGCEYLQVEGKHFFMFENDGARMAEFAEIINSRIKNSLGKVKIQKM